MSHDLNLSLLERDTILEALRRSEWVQKDAAILLGISPRSLNYKIAIYGITHRRWFAIDP